MEPKATASSGGQPDEDTRSAASLSLSESLAQGKEVLGAAAAGAMESAATGLHSLQDNVSALKATATHFVSETGADAARSAADLASNVKVRVSDVAGDLAERGADAASRATAKAKSLGDHLEGVVRSNPLGAILGAVVIGALLGMRGRGRRR
jgi:ElaB/YqjD/DUF883 family membrane-anchored ribosome-binding protein